MKALLVVLVVAVAACAASGTSPATDPRGSEVDILTSRGSIGGNEALGQYTLLYDPDLNCLYSEEPDNNGEPGTGGRVIIEWPAGYEAFFLNGVGTVYDETGAVFAETGEAFQTAGGGGPYSGDHCNAIGIWTITP